MTNTALLEKKIADSGLKKGFIAKELGMATHSLANKITGRTEFVASEIKDLCVVLNITDLKEKNNIFFA